jgi:aryl-alcohol dehydrogenase-like predicted oxidoreductase
VTDLQTRRLGRTGLHVVAVGLGAMDTPGSEEAAATVHAAIDGGVNFIDTAREYAGSEYLLGQVIRERGRLDFHVATKTFSHTADGAQRDVDRSLSMLGVEAVDLYQLHDVSTPEAWAEVMDEDRGALAGLRIAQYRGLVRHIGVSTHNLDVLRAIIESDAFDTVMVDYSAFHPESAALIEAAAAHDLGVIVMRPVGGSGRTSIMRGQAARGEAGAVTPAALLRHVLSHPGVSVAIPGARHPSRVRENLDTLARFTPMPPEEQRALEAAARAFDAT